MANATGIVTSADDQGQAARHGQPQMGGELVPPGTAEVGEDQRGEPAERGEQRHLRVADDLERQREQARHHDGGPDGAQQRRRRPADPPRGRQGHRGKV
jgi:hypothetical protein